MFRMTSLLATTLLIAACNTTANTNPSPLAPSPNSTPATSSPTSVSSTPITSTELPQVQCSGEIPAPLKVTLGEYRLANKSDFITSIREFTEPQSPQKQFTCTIFTADFNEDGQKDYALLLVDEKASKSQFRLALNQGNGQFKSAVVRDYATPPKTVAGLIYTAMFLKPSGELGVAERSYFPLKPNTPEREMFVSKAAIELWRPFAPDIPSSAKADPANYTIDAVAYCSEVFYFVDGKLKTTAVCD